MRQKFVFFHFFLLKILIHTFMCLMNPEISKSVTPPKILLHIKSFTFDCLLRITGTTKMKSGQISVELLVTNPNSFLHSFWRLETSSRSFYDFDKMTVWCDLRDFGSWCSLFFSIFEHIFKREKSQKLIAVGFWLIMVGW